MIVTACALIALGIIVAAVVGWAAWLDRGQPAPGEQQPGWATGELPAIREELRSFLAAPIGSLAPGQPAGEPSPAMLSSAMTRAWAPSRKSDSADTLIARWTAETDEFIRALTAR